MPDSRYQTTRRSAIILLAIILVAAAALRLPTLGIQSLWADEGATWSQVNGSLADVVTRTAADNYPPLFNILAWASIRLLGDAEWALRLPAALLGIANVWLLYCLGTRLGGRTAGLLAATLLALSAFHIWYSQEARMYTLLAFAATAHTYALLVFIDRQSLRNALLTFLAGAALVYSHPFGALTWIAIGIGAVGSLALRRDMRGFWRLVALSVAVGLAFLPWAIVLLGRARSISEAGFWIAPVTPAGVWSAAHKATDALLLLLIAAACLLLARRTSAHPNGRHLGPVLICWAIIPLVMAIVASIAIEPVLHPRYLIGSVPAAILLAALGMASVVRRRQSAIAFSLATVGLATLAMYIATPDPRQDWRSALAHVKSSLGPDDCLVLTSDPDLTPINYYYRSPPACFIRLDDLNALPAAPSGDFLLISSAQSRSEAERAAIKHLEETVGPDDRATFHRIVVHRFASSNRQK